MSAPALPLFHLYGDPPDDQAFDFIHVETIASRSSVHDWLIRAHRHRNLWQVLVIERGGGEMTYEASTMEFAAPAAILILPNVAHGFRFRPELTDGWVVTFTEDVADALGEQSAEAIDHDGFGSKRSKIMNVIDSNASEHDVARKPLRTFRHHALARLRSLAAEPVIPLAAAHESRRLSTLCRDLHEERSLAREGYRLASRALLALIAIEVVRLAASRARSGAVTLSAADGMVGALRRLVEQHFRKQRQIGFYADRLAMTADRLNAHVKRATGVTAGHLIRQRVLTEAKRELVFTARAVAEIAYDLGFADPSHFGRFFRKQTGTTPQAFRDGQGG